MQYNIWFISWIFYIKQNIFILQESRVFSPWLTSEKMYGGTNESPLYYHQRKAHLLKSIVQNHTQVLHRQFWGRVWKNKKNCDFVATEVGGLFYLFPYGNTPTKFSVVILTTN